MYHSGSLNVLSWSSRTILAAECSELEFVYRSVGLNVLSWSSCTLWHNLNDTTAKSKTLFGIGGLFSDIITLEEEGFSGVRKTTPLPLRFSGVRKTLF